MDENTTVKDLSWFKSHDQVTTKPKLSDLYEHITPRYALKWKVIGALLGLPSERLDIIERDNFYQTEPGCNAMLQWWLRVDPTASWGKLFTVIESPAVSSGEAVDKGDWHPEATKKVYQEFRLKLITSLPMDNVIFLELLRKENLYYSDLREQVQAKSTNAEKIALFLDKAIEPSLLINKIESFRKLLTVMSDDEYLKSDLLSGLAEEIQQQLIKETLLISKRVTSSNSNLNKPTVTDKGANAVSILSEMVSQRNLQERFNSDEETWPPDQPKNFTPLVLIHHQGQHSMKQPTVVAQVIQTGDIDSITTMAGNQSVPKHHPKLDSHEPLQEILDSSTVTKELAEILAPLEQSKDPQFILFEGAPGIGKSILLKEMAYRWGNEQILKTFKFVLLIHLRNPSVQQASLLEDLLQLYCNREDTRATKIVTACSDYLVQNDGKGLAFLFDGFDEYPEELQKNSFIADILRRKVLPYCALVVSSRPHATVHLRKQATLRVDILGFTEVERNQFIQQALKERPQSIKELTQYLEDHFTISSLCVVPFNMVVLLFLYKERSCLPNKSLPKNSTQLYNHFICLTICRHLAKHGHSLDNTITDLTNLPDPCSKIIQKLSKFSLEALNNNKLVFTFDEIKAACPDIAAIPGAINGFGLLQAVQHFGLTGKTMTFNFLHFTIQEFLAAHHVASLSPNKELKILKEKFWSDIHSNMFAIYISLTKGQRASFKQFIKPSLGRRLKGFLSKEQVENKFLEDKVKCFHLFRCFFEAGDKEMCRSIENAKSLNFSSKTMNLTYITLSATDVECVTVFLTCSSHKEWKELDLRYCYIQDQGVHILHRGLINSSVTITSLSLWYNSLTESSFSAISDITISCRVKRLDIGTNKTVSEDERLYSIISDPSSVLEELYMYHTKLSSNAAIKLFAALSDSKKLRILDIRSNDITDEACDAIIMAMKKNTSLVELYMHYNRISGECAQLIVEALQHNNTLQLLDLPFYSGDVKERIRLSAEEVNKKRENRNCEVKLMIRW